MSLRIGRNSRQVEDRKIEEVVNLLSIHTLLDKLPYQMSGGERQRVATAKAIVRNPSVFLMDEPFASLDAAMKEELRVEVVVLQKKLGITMIFVTHDQVEAMTMGDHIAVIKEGILQQVGTPNEIYNMPANVFVGSFVGSPSMNFFQVSVKKCDNNYIFEHPKFHLELSKKLTEYFGKFLEEKKSVIIGLRPQHVTFLEKPEQGVLKGQIYAIERLGKETRVTVDYGGKDKLKAIMSPLFNKTMGDVVYTLPKVEDLYFFDSEKERKLLFKLDQTLNDK
jgi:ABC-type sugar transport system ATPase subunit